MNITNESTAKILHAFDKDFIKSQTEQAITTYGNQINLFVQVITILTLANVTVVGYAISEKIAGIIGIGSFFPLMIIGTAMLANEITLPIIYTAVSLEQKYGSEEMDWVASTFVSTIFSIEYLQKFKEISKISDPSERIRQLKLVKIPIFQKDKGIMRRSSGIAFILFFAVQFILPFILHFWFGWRLI